MAASDAQFSYGSKVALSTDDITYTDVGEVAMIQFPDKTRKEAKATHLASDDGYTETKPAMKDSSKPTVTINLVPAQYTTLDTYFEAGTILYVRFRVPLRSGQSTAEQWKMNAWISKLGGPKADPEDANVQQCEIEFTRSSAKPTHAIGS